MVKTKSLNIEGLNVGVYNLNEDEYICISDMAKYRDDSRTDYIVQNWLRNKNTLEFVGLWEQLNNPSFNSIEFDGIKNSAGVNAFTITPKKWINLTGAIGIVSKAGRYGGTYAHKDIAFEFATWLSPVFKLWLLKEFQRLKQLESSTYNIEWDVKRILAKVNYRIHTDAIQEFIIPKSKFSKDRKWLEYALEADLLNIALFGCTAKEWKEANPTLSLQNKNIRDIASINELTVLANLESINAEMVRSNVAKEVRFNRMKEIAKSQLKSIEGMDIMKSVRKSQDSNYIEPPQEKTNSQSKFNKNLKQALNWNPNTKEE